MTDERKKPKWQRARIILCSPLPAAVGKEIWLKIGKPTLDTGPDIITRRNVTFESFEMNIYEPSTKRLLHIAKHQIEFLARGPEDFADDDEIPRASWTEFVRSLDAKD